MNQRVSVIILCTVAFLGLTGFLSDCSGPTTTEPQATTEDTAHNPCKGLDEVNCGTKVACEWRAGQQGDTKKCKPRE